MELDVTKEKRHHFQTRRRCLPRILLAGQPNSGKTTIFNALTGASRHVGNYPGVTVEQRSGFARIEGNRFEVVDLPGTYSLGALSPEESVARKELLDGGADVVVVVVDSTSLTRSLMLFAQIALLDLPVVLVLNMSDEADVEGLEFDLGLMSILLGCPVVRTTGHRRVGLDLLRDACGSAHREGGAPRRPLIGRMLGTALSEIGAELSTAGAEWDRVDWLAYGALVGDAEAGERLAVLGEAGDRALEVGRRAREAIEAWTGDEIGVFVSKRFHGFAHGVVVETVRRRGPGRSRVVSDMVDRFLVHRILGLPIFFALMYVIFWATFTIGEYPMIWIERGFEMISVRIAGAWPAVVLPDLRSLLLDGVIAGVGGVVVFLPNIAILFLGLTLIEDSGYMARAAFLSDRLMHRFGLHGKSFLPMITGFGCTVPAIMATRTLENQRDRLATMLVLPLMSCGARLPIWMLLVPAFVAPQLRAPVLGGIYFLGVVAALLLALVLRKTALRGEEALFVMELPPYRLPAARSVLSKVSERSWLYVKKAGTVIFAISILMWLATSYPKPNSYAVDERVAAGERLSGDEVRGARMAEDIEYSLAGRLGKALELVVRPLGFDWKLATGMIGAFAAKEVFVAQMGIVYSLGGEDGDGTALSEKIARDYSPLVGISLIIFLLIATPCMATVAVTRRESGSWKWAALQFFGLTLLAYVLSLFVFQVGSLIGV